MWYIVARDIAHASILLSLDLKKAFTRVKRSFVQQVLQKLRFGEGFLKFKTEWHNKRTAVLSISGFKTVTFQSTKGVQQRDSISHFRFFIQMIPLCEMIQLQRSVCGNKLSTVSVIPTESYFADSALLKAKLDAATIKPYQATEEYCRGLGALLQSQKSEPTSVTPHNEEHLGNKINIMKEGQTAKLLGTPIGVDLSRKQMVQGAIIDMIKRCHERDNKFRTYQCRHL